MNSKDEIEKLSNDLKECSKLLTAFGDETRQYLILEMMKLNNCTGVRVLQITEKTNLSRPAISHHLQILKNAGIIKMRKEGTKNYYYFQPDVDSFEKLISTLTLALKLSNSHPDRTKNKIINIKNGGK